MEGLVFPKGRLLLKPYSMSEDTVTLLLTNHKYEDNLWDWFGTRQEVRELHDLMLFYTKNKISVHKKIHAPMRRLERFAKSSFPCTQKFIYLP